MKSVLFVPFRELGPIVEPWLEHSVGARPSEGIPPHVTVLFPCPADIGDALDGFEAFDVVFREARRFPDAVYLAPEPAAPFVAMTEAMVDRFPEWQPYGGEFDSIVPHLTVAWGAMLDEAEAHVRPRLPLRARAREAVLLSEVEPRRWEPRESFPLVSA